MHKSQGFGDRRSRGAWPADPTVHAPGRRAGDEGHYRRRRHDLGPLAQRGRVAKLADEVIAKFNPTIPPRACPRCWRSASGSAHSPPTSLWPRSGVSSTGRSRDASVSWSRRPSPPQVVPGEVLHLRHSATVSAGVPVRWLSASYPLTGRSVAQPIELTAGRPATRDVDQTLPADTPLGQPYWLREEHTVGLFRVEPGTLIGHPRTHRPSRSCTDSRWATRPWRSAMCPCRPPGRGNRHGGST